MTTEKELDTVEVLKAIQKAKEVKSKLGQPEKKVGLYGRSGGEEQPRKELAPVNWALGILPATES